MTWSLLHVVLCFCLTVWAFDLVNVREENSLKVSNLFWEIHWHFGKHACSCSCWDLDKKTDTQQWKLKSHDLDLSHTWGTNLMTSASTWQILVTWPGLYLVFIKNDSCLDLDLSLLTEKHLMPSPKPKDEKVWYLRDWFYHFIFIHYLNELMLSMFIPSELTPKTPHPPLSEQRVLTNGKLWRSHITLLSYSWGKLIKEDNFISLQEACFSSK